MRSAIPSGSISNSYYRAARRSVEAILRTSQPTGRERRRAFPRRASIAASTGRVAHAPATRGPRAGRRTGDGRELRATWVAGGVEDEGVKQFAGNVRMQML